MLPSFEASTVEDQDDESIHDEFIDYIEQLRLEKRQRGLPLQRAYLQQCELKGAMSRNAVRNTPRPSRHLTPTFDIDDPVEAKRFFQHLRQLVRLQDVFQGETHLRAERQHRLENIRDHLHHANFGSVDARIVRFENSSNHNAAMSGSHRASTSNDNALGSTRTPFPSQAQLLSSPTPPRPSIARLRFERDLAERKRREEAEWQALQVSFRARPVPDSSRGEKWAEMLAAREALRLAHIQQRRAQLESLSKAFSFYGPPSPSLSPDSKVGRRSAKEAVEAPCDAVHFRARPIPPGLLDGDRLQSAALHAESERAKRLQQRKEWLIRTASAPPCALKPSRGQRKCKCYDPNAECTFRPQLSHSNPTRGTRDTPQFWVHQVGATESSRQVAVPSSRFRRPVDSSANGKPVTEVESADSTSHSNGEPRELTQNASKRPPKVDMSAKEDRPTSRPTNSSLLKEKAVKERLEAAKAKLVESINPPAWHSKKPRQPWHNRPATAVECTVQHVLEIDVDHNGLTLSDLQ